MPWSGRSDHSDIASEAICLPKNFAKALSSIFPGMTLIPRRNSFGNNGHAIYWGGGAVLADKVFYGQCENVEWLRMASSYIESVLICALCLKFLIRLNNMQGSTVDKK